ncbi:hypothetical protein VOLCADRAFT_100770 [Volvox carteri f. nagariensis]|uniref:Uncharacterized protein n=1 Tax=Volvox carteri f. nagariensis TaxID=3068 RepID=D8UKZ6_VOLCA|nr:uncharacterized protein VOLCADRAFT_100770 [Volvox carteri f. nagariensis]EFJ39602.1 hypothetical protein VOLCADRAFT_100770 [Volvox carteri f. nagariensis]|eukprot:XP_002959334.1 hypothetical protein VOLCADRAFT_100770 [Volvox carteri f. nagariensis]
MCPDRGLMMCLQAVVCSLSSRFIGLIMSLTLRYLTCQVLADGVSPDTAPAVHIVLLTSPKKTTMKEMRKAVAVTWYMPFWELKELLDCRSKMYSAVPEATVEELYTYYGGVARYVLEQPLKNPNWMLSKLQEPLISTIDASNVSQVLKGYLFEAVMHAALATGGKFDVLPLDPKTLERGKEEKLDIPECKQYNIFTDNEVHGMMSTKMDTYLRPKSSNFPVIDALMEMRKAVAVTWYMPFWELKELLDCRSKMYSAVPEATVEELYTYYGGVARYVLEQPLKNPNWMLSKLQEPLISTIDASNVSQVLKGYLFEAVMHAALATGGKFDVLPLDPKTLERGKEEKLDIPECKQYNIFTDNEVHGMMSTKMDTYLRPKSSNFPVIDALMVLAMYLFQMTVSAMKEINADDLEDVFKRLGISAPGQEGRQPSLYFVVDPSIYNKFKQLLTWRVDWISGSVVLAVLV